MATATHTTDATRMPAFQRLSEMPRVQIMLAPYKRDPNDIALIFFGIRNCNIRATGSTFSASFHIGMNEHLPIATGVSLASAFASVALLVSLLAGVPVEYSAANHAAERAAVAEVVAAFAPSFAIAA